MSFESDIRSFGLKVQTRLKDVVTESGIEVQRSLVEGSELTGAPGQPVDTGNLKSSFIAERLSDYEWQITTNVEYAPEIEENLRGATLRSKVGGFHSKALTEAGFPRIVDVSVKRVVPK